MSNKLLFIKPDLNLNEKLSIKKLIESGKVKYVDSQL